MLTVLDADKRLEEIEPYFSRILRRSMIKPSFFLMVCDTSNRELENKYINIRQNLEHFDYKGQYLPLTELELTPREVELTDAHLFSESVKFRCLAIDVGASEQMRDRIKEALWKVQECQYTSTEQPKEIESLKCRLEGLAFSLSTPYLQRGIIDRPSRRVPFKVRNHGLFVPAISRKVKGVKLHSFDHGGGHYYRYRLASNKLYPSLLDYPNLNEYLNSLFTDCPNHFFKRGPRISALRWSLRPSCVYLGNDEMSKMVEAALIEAKYKTAHTNVEVYLIENDPKTVASEVPVWLEPGELREWAGLFNTSECLTGHIDILRYEEGVIEIWDYKPDAAVEQHAGLQVFIYAIALSIRTNISLKNFVCGYFDRNNAYLIYPSRPDLTNNKTSP